jgi:hypothetical protein
MFYYKHPNYKEIDKILLEWYKGKINKVECFIKIKKITSN